MRRLVVHDGCGDQRSVLRRLGFPLCVVHRVGEIPRQSHHTDDQGQGDQANQLALGDAPGWQRPQLLEVRRLLEHIVLLHRVHQGIVSTAVFPLGGGQHHPGAAGIAAPAERRLPFGGRRFRRCFGVLFLRAGDALFGQTEQGLFLPGRLRHVYMGRWSGRAGFRFGAQTILQLLTGILAGLELRHFRRQHLPVVRGNADVAVFIHAHVFLGHLVVPQLTAPGGRDRPLGFQLRTAADAARQ